MSQRRKEIVEKLLGVIRGIGKDQPVGPDVWGRPTGANYLTTPSLVGLGILAIADLADSEFPAVRLSPDGPTTYEAGADGTSYEARWLFGLVLYVKNQESGTDRTEAETIFDLLENVRFDIERAVAVAEPTFGPDVSISLDTWDPEPYTDPRFGIGTLVLEVLYQHDLFAESPCP